jgi:type II secretory pathway pseudopilin PulG
MEILLLAITVVSVLLAAVMAYTAWRLANENRARSASRVAALVAAAADERNAAAEPTIERPISRPIERPVEPIAVNDARPALWRSPAVAPERPVFRRSPAADLPLAQAAPPDLGETFLGTAVKPSGGGGQRGLAIAAAVLFVGLVTTGYFVMFGGDGSSGATAAHAVSTEHPLELVSLGHQRRNASLALTGLVRNPSNGQPVEQLSAVAFLFDREGRFVTSAKADVDFRKLTPGDESPFVITVDAPATVARYRVSFRTEAGVVPHVDRRGQEPIARELP